MKTREIVLAFILVCAIVLSLYYMQLQVEASQAPVKKKKAKLRSVPIAIEDIEEEEDDSIEEEDTEEEIGE